VATIEGKTVAIKEDNSCKDMMGQILIIRVWTLELERCCK
jgi:hypothetical protein